MSFTNILPDPNNNIAPSGTTNGTGAGAGPGYATVSLKSSFPTQTTRTNSGSTIVRNVGGHNWEMNIGYNPLTRAQFEPLYSFLISRKGASSHFFVELPQYKTPQDSKFRAGAAGAAFVNALKPVSDANPGAAVAVNPGIDNFFIGSASTAYIPGTHGTPSVGDVFSINDSSNSSHKKVYMVTRVEITGSNNFVGTDPGTNKAKIHFTPPLQKLVSSGSTLTFEDVKFRVTMKSNDINYSLNVDSLYTLSLSLQETQT